MREKPGKAETRLLITIVSYNLFCSSHLRCGYLHKFSNNATESGDMISMSRNVMAADMVAPMCQSFDPKSCWPSSQSNYVSP